MIPLTPILLVTAAHALARHAPRLARLQAPMPCSLEFVLQAGATAHFDLRVGRTSWPVGRVTTLGELRALARRRGWERARIEVGDLVVFRELDDAGVTMAEEVGIVMDVDDPLLSTDGTIRRCAIAWARAEGEGAMRIEEGVRWCSTRNGDLAIRWSAGWDELERAA